MFHFWKLCFVVTYCLVLLSGCYVTRQALHQNNLFNSREPVSEVMADPAADAKTKERLEDVRRIMAYAKSQGLNTEGAYRYYIELNGDVVSYIVQAAEPDRLKSVTWWFPIVGSVPYLGYFKKEERDQKAEKLGAEGYDVHTGGAGAFSSLGWFDDPIFSSMLRRPFADLAHLFFHELTHRTLWISGSTTFNENLAEYVGIHLTIAYLKELERKEELATYLAKRDDRALFKDWLRRLKGELERLYDHPPKGREALLAQKDYIFADYQRLPKKPAFKALDYVKGEDWNNAAVLAASLYAPDTKRFAKAHACLGLVKIGQFLEALERADNEVGDSFAALDNLCANR